MHVIVIGSGKVGSKFAHVLSEEGHDVVIVDNDREALEELALTFNGVTMVGVPIDQDVLKNAGIESADALAAVTQDDNINIMVSQVAKEIFHVPKVIARIFNPTREYVFHQFGLTTICPTNVTVDVIKGMILDQEGMSTHMIGGEVIRFCNKNINKNYIGTSLKDIKSDAEAMIFGVLRKGHVIFYEPSLVLQKDDQIIFATK